MKESNCNKIISPTIQNHRIFKVEDIPTFKGKAMQWLSLFEVACCLDSNEYKEDKYTQYELLIAAGLKEELRIPLGEMTASLSANDTAFDQLKQFWEKHRSWTFGFLSYDLKNQIEKLHSKNEDQLGFPDLHFFVPEILIQIKGDELMIHAQNPLEVFDRINAQVIKIGEPVSRKKKIEIKSKIDQANYLKTIDIIRTHIEDGDLYEMNFCQEFFIEAYQGKPLALFQALNDVSKAPFSVFYKNKNHYLLSASPERFLKKEGQQLISQPIKGTIKRGESKSQDALLRKQLRASEKDQAENVMIVDLVRNDLARSCKPGTIKVEELFGIYGFEQVFQMISTVKGELRPDVHFVDAIRNAFPMGSMTGAPKVMSMELIEKYEQSRRGLYSGAFGYIDSEGDFDFNVVIRSILYNAEKAYLSFQVGGAIVYDSDPIAEYEECLLKAKGIRQVLSI